MKLGVLFSGGKDSCMAASLAQQHGHDIVLLCIISQNEHSYLFHTPNISRTSMQAEAMGLPLLTGFSQGEKEKELLDLKKLMQEAVEKHHIEGIITGAIASVYQATRIQKICHELNMWCFNPLWQRDAYEHTKELVSLGFEIYISAVAAYPLDEGFLGRRIDDDLLKELEVLLEKHHISPAGEGGEFETFVAFGPKWKQRVVVKNAESVFKEGAGRWIIHDAKLIPGTRSKELADSDLSDVLRNGSLLGSQKSSISEEATPLSSSPKKENNCLLVSTCAHKLHELEFVLPIKNIVGECSVAHYKDNYTPNDYKRIIICGTALKDDAFLKQLESFSWLKNYDNPVLGICAGFQILGFMHKQELDENLEIGFFPLEKPLQTKFGDVKEMYLLHHNCLQGTKYYFEKKKQYGILFHPEVRNEHLINRFITL